MEIGLAARVFPADRLLEETMKVAKNLANRSQMSLRAIKIAVDRGADVDLKSGCSLEAEALAVCFGSRNAREGIAAFVEKRKPNFQGSLKE
jgi:enoyl-CoA hydratase